MNRSEAGKLGNLKTKALHEENYRKRIEDYTKQPKLCLMCNKVLPYKKRCNRFCGRSCGTTYANLSRTIGSFKSGDYVIEPHPCAYCGKMIEARKNRKCCSPQCNTNHRWKTRKAEIISLGEIVSNHTWTAKKYLVETYDYKCVVCGLSEWLGQKLPLVLDHIDGNSDNWKLNNVRLICSNCDSLTPTYKSKNIGKGRHYRRQRYKEGKSY